MKFSEFTYERPSVKTFIEAFEIQLSVFKNADSFAEQKSAILSINELRSDFDSMGSLASVRHSIDTKNNYYEEENTFFDNNYPELTSYINDYYRALLVSPFRKDLEAEFGKQLFVIAELSLKSFEPEIIEDLKIENKLDSQYRKIKAQAIIEFEGKEYNLSSISPLELSKNRTTRKGAAEAKWALKNG